MRSFLVAIGRRPLGRIASCTSTAPPSLYALPRFVGEIVPTRALTPGAGGFVCHARDPNAVLEPAGAANALVPLVPP